MSKLLTVIGLLATGFAGPAYCHDWYPIECCSAIDCAPVISSSYVAGAIWDAQEKRMVTGLPHMVVTTARGTFVLPDNLPRRVSKDNRMHVCNHASGLVICIFEPPSM